MIEPISITTVNLDNQKIIYIRFRGSYLEFRKNSRKLFKELFEFGIKNELINPDVTKVLTMYNDNPFITKDENLRSSILGKFGVGHFNISAKEYEQAWHYMYQEWLFKDESQIRDAVPFELYVTEPAKNMTDKSLTDIYIPIN